MERNAGSDYERFVERTNKIPAVKEYLSSFSVIVGDLVLARRIQIGWSQQQLAEAAGTTQARISKIEAGHSGVKMETIDKVFHALGLTKIDLTYREDAAGRELLVTR